MKNFFIGCGIAATLFFSINVSADNGDMVKHDYSNRVSLYEPVLLAGFNDSTDGFSAGDDTSTSFSDLKIFGSKPHEGSKALWVKPEKMAANKWRTIHKDYHKALNLSATPLMEFAIFSQEGPAMTQYVRLSLFSGNEQFDAVAQILPSLWRTVIFDLSECRFLKKISRIEIGLMCDTSCVWASGRDFMVDGVRAGKPLDLNFMLPGASERFSAFGGKVSQANDALIFTFKNKNAALFTTQLKGSRNNLFSPPLIDRNTVRVVMENRSPADKVRLSFITDEDSVFDAKKSKVFDIQPNSPMANYMFNVSDNKYLKGHLAGLKLEPIDGTKGQWLIDRITFEQEAPIRDFAGKISSCTADSAYVHIKGIVSPEYVGKYKKLAIYEAPMILNDSTLSNHKLLYTAPISGDFSIDNLPNSRLNGKMTHLSTRFLAVVLNDSTDFVPIAPCFYIENWKDFTKNPYDFNLPDNVFDVTKYGAKGDGFSNDSHAFQRAIDACSAAGGGKVVVPGNDNQYERRYVLTSITMKSNVELHIEKGAILWQSGDLRDYDYRPAYGHDFVIPGTPWTHCLYINLPMIKGNYLKNVKITGPGVIRMNDPYTLNPDWSHYAKTCSDRIHILPIGMNFCKNVVIEDLDILRSNNYHTNFHGDENMFFGNVKLHEVKCVSGDGFSFGQGTHHVRIERVFFDSNDDGIVLTTSYKDPRSRISPWRPEDNDADHSLRDIKVEHSYINSATGGGGKAIALIPWGSTNPDQQKQLLDSICVYDCVLSGGYSVGTWPDNPFDGKPFTNGETNDYSPVQNFRIFNNEYISPCDLLCISPTNFVDDCNIHSSDTIKNGNFKDGDAYWTRLGNCGVSQKQGRVNDNGFLCEGLYLKHGIYLLSAEVKGDGALKAKETLSEKELALKKFNCADWTMVTMKIEIPEDIDCLAGVCGGNAMIRNCSIAKSE